MENEWSYKSLSIKEGLKPGSKHFQYFFVVSEGEQKNATIASGLKMRPWRALAPQRISRRFLTLTEGIGTNGSRRRLTRRISETWS